MSAACHPALLRGNSRLVLTIAYWLSVVAFNSTLRSRYTCDRHLSPVQKEVCFLSSREKTSFSAEGKREVRRLFISWLLINTLIQRPIDFVSTVLNNSVKSSLSTFVSGNSS